jgi:quercetin dioxygenase-like cupin family protein
MELLSKQPTLKLPEKMFTADAWDDVIYRGEEPSRARANAVRFAPGARTAWHSHGLGQTLYIGEGIALTQSRGGEILQAHPGDVIWTPPGEEHWHGAAPDHFHGPHRAVGDRRGRLARPRHRRRVRRPPPQHPQRLTHRPHRLPAPCFPRAGPLL